MGTDNTSILGYNPGGTRYHSSIMINNLATNHHHNISPGSSLNYSQWQQNSPSAAPCHLYYHQQQQWAKYYGHSAPKRYYQHRHFTDRNRGKLGQAEVDQKPQGAQILRKRRVSDCMDDEDTMLQDREGSGCGLVLGKGLKDGGSGDEKKDDSGDGLWANVEAQAAFLGPNIWDKNLPYDADLKYVDLDEFLSENGIPLDQSPPPLAIATSSSSSPTSVMRGGDGGGSGGEGSSHQQGGLAARRGVMSELHVATSVAESHDSRSSEGLGTKRERSPSPFDPPLSPSTVGPPSPTDSTMSFSSNNGRDFDPRTRQFSDEELKPQPMIKKSRKQFVPDDLKDDKYWARRRKNNMAAKRSRDARRVKENQIALRAGYLEKENSTLKQEVDRLKKENNSLRNKLDKASSKNN